jgi:oligosaccharide 4-alpha-D-glucosyltransferase
MKKYTACLLACICSLQLIAQGITDGKWTYSLYPGNIVKLNWRGSASVRNEQLSDAVIAKPLTAQKLPAGIQVKRFDNSLTVNIKGATVHFLYGFDSGHHRGVSILLQPGEKLFGGGERALPLNRVGQRITLYNNPWYGYGEGADQLNYSVPVLLSTAGYGLLFDNPSKGYFDVGKTHPGIFEAGFESGAIDIYIIPGKNMDEILQNYASLTGKQPLPPRWALGNFVSRFGYRNQQQAEAVLQRMKQDKFPADAIILDLFWFGDSIKGTLGNLNWKRDKWPSPESMITNFKKENINTILVTEPFFLQGTKNYEGSLPYLATDSSGKPYTLQDFYFGKGGLIDLFRPEAQQWFWQFYKQQIDKGIAGWWGDLGEPEKHPADMYHNVSSFNVTRRMSANEVHNMYGHQWSKMLSQHYKQEYPAQRLFYLNRAGFAGSQRYNVFPWTGDVSRSWSGFRAQLLNLQSMSLSGIPYIHSDAGGFGGGDNDPELYIRWLQFAAYTPIFRPHGTALGNLEPGVKDIPSEPTFQGEPYKTIASNLIKQRYALLPYNYSLAYQQTTLGKPLIRPMFYYTTTDTVLLQVPDEYMWGDAFLVAPVLQQGATSRKVYLPQGQWYNLENNTEKAGGEWITDSTNIAIMPVYVKGGSFVPMWDASPYTSTASYNSETPLTIRYYPSSTNSSYTFFDDDGKSPRSISLKQFQELVFSANTINNITRININAKNWPKGSKRQLTIQLPANKLSSISINNKDAGIKRINQWQGAEVLFDGKPLQLVIR